MYPTYTHLMFLLAAFMFGMLIGGWLLSAYIRLSEQISSIGCDDPTEPQGYVDQDGEDFYPGRDAWKRNNGIKVPHADASAATFHRPHVQD